MPGPKYYTPAQANAALPYVGAVVRDIVALAGELRDLHGKIGELSEGHDRDALERAEDEFEEKVGRMRGYEAELAAVGVELKDHLTGLIDFRWLKDGREVYLCWRLGEAEVAHWHELHAGFAGRRRLSAADRQPERTREGRA
jgi:hypothetical protein